MPLRGGRGLVQQGAVGATEHVCWCGRNAYRADKRKWGVECSEGFREGVHWLVCLCDFRSALP
jgi:hypothetical protein